jgi:hypothetical protein
MLTQNQKQLIENLEREFTKLNKPLEQATNRLISKENLDNRRNESSKLIVELKAIENANNEAIQEMIDRDVSRLNEDLIEMGLIAFTDRDRDIIIKNKKENGYTIYDGSMRLRYTRSQHYHSLPNDTTFSYYPKFNGIGVYLTPHREEIFKDIDTLCSDNRFLRRIESLYNR